MNFFSNIRKLLIVGLVLFFSTTTLHAVYIQTYQSINNGAVTFTGNTLGLSKATGSNEPGTADSIGAFISQNNSIRVNSYPYGTTLDYSENGSSAYLDLPPGSVILYAELVWAGSYGYDPSITLSLVDSTQVQFITPDGTTHLLSPKPNYPALGGTGQSVVHGLNEGFYVRSQDVTALVASDVANFVATNPNDYYSKSYVTGGVPGTVIASDNNNNSAGWVLLVAFENQGMLSSQITLYVACEASGADPSHVTGFATPSTGSVFGRIFTAALEGDASLTGDQFKVGPGTTNPPATNLSGTNNPSNNFFGSQINTLLQFTTDVATGKLVYSGSGQLDVRGSFGSYNSDPFTGTNTTAARQGMDITSIDISTSLVNNQADLYAQGTTSGDFYIVTSLGMLVQQNAPIIKSIKTASSTSVNLGDSVTFTSEFENIGTDKAMSLIFVDVLPPGLTFTSNSFTLSDNGGSPVVIPITASDLTTGVDLSSYVSNLDVDDFITIAFDVTVTDYYSIYENTAKLNYEFSSPALNAVSQTNTVTLTGLLPPPPVANPDSYATQVNTSLNITPPGLLANDSGTSISVVPVNDLLTTHGGMCSIFADGSFVYNPPVDYSGSGGNADSFNYTIQDPYNQSSVSFVTITITPKAINDSGSVAANTTLNSLASVFSNDLGSTPFSLISYTQPTVAGSVVSIDLNGNYTYTPANKFSGLDTFTYIIADPSLQQSTATVTIDVLPAAADDYGVTPANTTLNGTSVFSNDPSVGILTNWQNPSSQGGSVTMVTSGANAGSYTYIPPSNFSGLDTFTYTVSDGVHPPVMATVHITVTPIANPDVGTAYTNVIFNQSVSVLNNDIGAGLSVYSTGTIPTIQGGSVEMNSDGTYAYHPPFNISGTDSFQYTLQDQVGSQSLAQVIITIIPQASNDSAITYKNTPINGSSVLTNDSPNNLTVVGVQSPSDEGGTVLMNANGTYYYNPPLDFLGQDQFLYTAEDIYGNQTVGTVYITVVARSIPPSPKNFSGVLTKCEFLNRNEYRLVATWNNPNNSNIVSYKIYQNGFLVKVIPASASLVFEKCARSKKAFYGYEISDVDIFGVESNRTKLKVAYE